MSLFSRRKILVSVVVFPLGACMFKPAYGPDGPAQEFAGKVEVADPTDKNGFDFFQRLSSRLGIPTLARYRLDFKLTTSVSSVGISQDNVLTRFNILGSVKWTLIDIATKEKIASGKVSNFSSYSSTGTTVAELAAKKNAYIRLMRNLADQVMLELVASAHGLLDEKVKS
ncbi:MAG: LPS-assembly lipoprotein [Paracoccaceae bacterium]|jgi:LPS-assembly lipoprotein